MASSNLTSPPATNNAESSRSEPPPTQAQLDQWRRDFELARSFEDEDDDVYYREAPTSPPPRQKKPGPPFSKKRSQESSPSKNTPVSTFAVKNRSVDNSDPPLKTKKPRFNPAAGAFSPGQTMGALMLLFFFIFCVGPVTAQDRLEDYLNNYNASTADQTININVFEFTIGIPYDTNDTDCPIAHHAYHTSLDTFRDIWVTNMTGSGNITVNLYLTSKLPHLANPIRGASPSIALLKKYNRAAIEKAGLRVSDITEYNDKMIYDTVLLLGDTPGAPSADKIAKVVLDAYKAARISIVDESKPL